MVLIIFDLLHKTQKKKPAVVLLFFGIIKPDGVPRNPPPWQLT